MKNLPSQQIIQNLINEINAEHKVDHLLADLNMALRDGPPERVEKLKEDLQRAVEELYQAKHTNNAMGLEGLVKR